MSMDDLTPKPPRRTGKWPDGHEEAAREAGYESWAEWGRQRAEELGRPICGAKRTNQWQPCGASPVRGSKSGRCKTHGGASPTGPDSPHWKDGSFSSYLPEDLRAIYQSIDADGLLSLIEHIRVAKALTLDLFKRLGEGQSAEAWERLRNELDEVRGGLNPGVLSEVEPFLDRLEAVIDTGRERFALLREIRDQEDHVRKLLDSQSKRDKIESEYMHRQEVIALLQQIAGDLQEVISDKKERQELGRRIVSRLGPDASSLMAPRPSAN